MKILITLTLGALLLSACGGGASLPITQAVVAPLAVTPASLSVNLGTPATLTISGGVAPYSITFSCPPSGATATLRGATITVVAITPYIVTCPLLVFDSKGTQIGVQVTLNYPG